MRARTAESYLAIDLGGSSGRVIRGSFDGGQLAVTEVHRFGNQPVEDAGRLHWDIRDLFREVSHGIAAGVATAQDTVSIGVTSWGVDFGLLDAGGRLLADPYCYRDSRLGAGLAIALEKLTWDELFASTGIQTIEINTLFQLAWMARHEPGLIRSAHRFLMIASLMDYWLTGRQAIEHTLATTSQCLDVQSRIWSANLLGRLDIPINPFPEIVQAGERSDPLSKAHARDLGLVRVPDVISTVAHDTGAAVTATPLTSRQSAFVSTGTWIMVGTEVREPVLTPRCRELNFTNEAGLEGTFQLLKNLTGLWLVQECRRAWDGSGISRSYRELFASARSAPQFTAVFDPEWQDLLAPGDMPAKILRRCDRVAAADLMDTGAVIRIVLESLALNVRRALAQLADVRGIAADSLHLSGGAVADPFFCQMIADACQLTVIAGPAEATAWGNLCVQAMSRGRLNGIAETRELIRNSALITRYEPDTGMTDMWNEHYIRLLAVAATSTYGINA
jgi:rhamnulokinase